MNLSKQKNRKKWKTLYKKHIKNDFKDWNEYFKIKMKLKRKFLKLVVKYSNSGRPLLECGCGTAKTSIYFSLKGLTTYAMDLEEDMVYEARKMSKKICKDNYPKIFKGNIKTIPYMNKFFSVTHSSGVLEHYEDNEIIDLINEQLRVSDYCIFSVPTSYFEKKMYGNERFLNRSQWRKIILKSNAKIVKESGYNYKTLTNRVKDVLKKPKRLFYPIALYIFVLKER